jgi:hypothetical protein
MGLKNKTRNYASHAGMHARDNVGYTKTQVEPCAVIAKAESFAQMLQYKTQQVQE